MTKYPSKLMKVSELTEWLNVSESAIYKWVQQGRFPKPIKLGDSATKKTVGKEVLLAQECAPTYDSMPLIMKASDTHPTPIQCMCPVD